MILSNVRKDENGEYDFDIHLTDNETTFLITYAITNLIMHGVLAVRETEEEQEVKLPNVPYAVPDKDMLN